MEYNYKSVACGGTFDRLHHGHEMFLEYAFSKGENVIIGLTSDRYVLEHKKKKGIQPFHKRQENLRTFLQNKGLLKRAKIIPIDTSFGPAINNDVSIEALIVTENTFVGAQVINTVRVKSGFSPLPIIAMPMVAIANIPISSSHIRKGIMNTQGDLMLPISLRETLKKPFGNILTDFSLIPTLDPKKIVTIGDATTKICNDLHIGQKFSVIDFVIKRKKTYKTIIELGFSGSEQVFYAENPPGQITRSLWQVIASMVENKDKQERSIIVIDGEEDLSVVPFILLLPEGWHIFYGQPDLGMVHIEVNEKVKAECLHILSLFKTTRGS